MDIKERVFESINNDIINGCDKSYYLISESSAIAEELINYDADLEDKIPEELIPFIDE